MPMKWNSHEERKVKHFATKMQWNS